MYKAAVKLPFVLDLTIEQEQEQEQNQNQRQATKEKPGLKSMQQYYVEKPTMCKIPIGNIKFFVVQCTHVRSADQKNRALFTLLNWFGKCA